MRTREEIERELLVRGSGNYGDILLLETLLDIRDLLVEAELVVIKKKPNSGMGDGRGGDGIGKAPYVAGRTLCGKIYPSGQERCNSGVCNVCYPTN